MSTRVISTAINVRVNLGNYQHLELVKQAQEQIEFSTQEEMISKEDSLRNDLVASLKRDMAEIPVLLNKGVEAAIKVQEAIKTTIPEWMGKEKVPNLLTDVAEKLEVKVAAEQKQAKDDAIKVNEDVLGAAREIVSISDTEKQKEAKEAEELFEDDFGLTQDPPKDEAIVAPVPKAEVVKPVEKKVEVKSKSKTDDDDFFGDDLFK